MTTIPRNLAGKQYCIGNGRQIGELTKPVHKPHKARFFHRSWYVTIHRLWTGVMFRTDKKFRNHQTVQEVLSYKSAHLCSNISSFR